MSTGGGGGSRWAVLSTMMSIGSTGWLSTASTRVGSKWQPKCKTVQLSTGEGAICDCGKLVMDATSLQIKQMTLGEVRQIVASGYKLAHGEPLVTIQWK